MSQELTEKIVHIQYELDELFEECNKLQEQLKDANHILKDVFISDAYYKSKRAQYLKKWGVK